MTRSNAMRFRKKLNATEIRTIHLSSLGMSPRKIAKLIGVHPDYPRQVLARVCRKIEIVGDHKRERVALYWNCELFRLGLKEKGLL